jgi:hypothetical protein
MPDGTEGGELTDLPGELEKWANAIKATTEAVNAVAKTLEENATRSVIVEVDNTTSRTLALHGSGDHDWGGFRQLPPNTVAPRTPGLFTSQSNGLLTGTAGNVQYRIDDEGTVFHVEWNNPFVGDNESLCRVEGTHPDFYVAAYVTGGGNTNVHMRFMLGEKADASKTERDWMTCMNCKGLFFSLDEGHCPAHPLGIASPPPDETISNMQAPWPAGLRPAPSGDFIQLIQGNPGGHPEGHSPAVDPMAGSPGSELFGKHEAAGYIFQLPYGIPGPNRFRGWRRCGYCKGLFFDGYESKGVCPGRRGGHVPEAQGHDFYLKYGMTPIGSQQDNWRFCDKCYGMFFLPQNANSICSAGGNHHAASESYVLDYL